MWKRRHAKKKVEGDSHSSSSGGSKASSGSNSKPSPVHTGNSLDTHGSDQVYQNTNAPKPVPLTEFEEYIQKKRLNGRMEEEYALLKPGQLFPCTVSTKEENKAKNRFRNMPAYDHSRVILQKMPDDPHSDYYNANFIKDQAKTAAFIACQGPNTASVNDFWRMICQKNVSSIVMLTNLMEKGKDRCRRYWPESVGASEVFGPCTVKWTTTESYADYVVRVLKVTYGKEERVVRQFHYQTWPDMDVPKHPAVLIGFVKRIKFLQDGQSSPLVVHCSAGIGRTGVFVALYSLIDAVLFSQKIDVFGFTESMRNDRMNMIQTVEQYNFLYDCLLEAYLTGETGLHVSKFKRFDVHDKQKRLQREFQLLRKLDSKVATTESNTTEETEKCRFPELVPLNRRRLYLQCQGSGENATNYINACLINTYRTQNAFIATQSPLPNTIEDFWRLVYDWKCPVIVMLNKIDPSDETCIKYWPSEGATQYGFLTVKLKGETEYPHYTHRKLMVSHEKSEQKKLSVHHLQLKSWHSNDPTGVLTLIRDMAKFQKNSKEEVPSVVHCINGVGHTGIFLCVNSELERLATEKRVDVFNSVRQLRNSSHHLVTTEDDYKSCYEMIRQSLTHQDDNTYANV